MSSPPGGRKGERTPARRADPLTVASMRADAGAAFGISIAAIEEARRTIGSAVLATPTLPAQRLSALTGSRVFVKYENLQVTNSFKERGALNKLSSLGRGAGARGVVAMSAGNHAQAVAYHAARLQIPATIVMPVTTPLVKIAATQAHGAVVLLDGETLTESEQRAHALATEQGLAFVHPYDDVAVIAGQGTIGLEILEQVPELDTLVLPIGGGGLIAGVAIAAKTVRPEIELIGVEAELYPSAWNAIKNEHRPVGGASLAEGIAVKNVGHLTLPVIRALVADIILVNESQLEQAVNAFATLQKTMAEGAGAAGLAAMLAQPARFRNKKVGLVLCGGNIDPRILATIMVRELEREDRIVSFRLMIPDRPGILGQIATKLGTLGANILEVEHKRLMLNVPAKGATLDITIETRDGSHAQAILSALRADGLAPRRVEGGRPTARSTLP